MSALKVVLSVLALLIGAAAGITQVGDWNVPQSVTDLMLSVGAALALVGVTPIALPPLVARILGAVSVVMIGALAAHAGGSDGSPSFAMKVLGFVAILMGLAAKFPVQPKPAATPPVAILLWLALGAAVAPGCDCSGDDIVRVATCAGGRTAWHEGTSLVCYEPDSTPIASRGWLPDDNADTACEFCEGFIEQGGSK